MMNLHKIVTLLFAALILLCGGCKKYLKESSQDELTPTTTASLSELLAKEGYPYIATSTTFNGTDGYSLCNHLNWLDDDAKLQNVTSQSAVVNYAKVFYSWADNSYTDAAAASAYAGGAKNPYQNLYNRIRGCNVVMDMLADVSGTTAEKEQMEGEALTLRAYYYWMLVNLYAWPYNDPVHDKSSSLGVPIIKKGSISDVPVARNTVKEVYDFIAADIERAVMLLEKQKKLSTLFRVNYRAAWLLASRIYLHMEEWDKVIQYAGKLIGDYPLLTDLNSWKVPTTQGVGTGTNANFIDPSNVEMLFLFSGVRSGDYQSFNVSASFYSLIASPALTGIYETDDMRFGVFTTTNPPPNFYLTRLSGYYQHSKFYFHGLASRSFRMSEAYVNRAEAYIRKVLKGGDATLLQKALDDLNYLRGRRFKAGSANATVTLASLDNDAQKVLTFCLTERRREFCFEEFRWFDLRRNGMPELVHTFNPNEPNVVNAALPVETFTLPQGSNRYVFRFPQNVIEANPLLVQNP
jgi:hypothetical protein